MISAATLGSWGILRPAEVIELAAAARLDLAAACTMLEKESGGGRNVWGSDGVSTGGTYVKGAEVRRVEYEAYRRAQDAGQIGAQGVGPTQLTYPPLQRTADGRGGCWDWRANVATGFEHLAQLQRQYGVRDGFRRYNGSGPAAERYADDAMQKLARWQLRIGTPTAAPPPAPRPTPVPVQEDDMTPAQEAKLDRALQLLDAMKPGVRLPGRSKGLAGTVDDEFGWTMTAAGIADTVLAELRALAARPVSADGLDVVDYDRLADAIIARMGAALGGKA